MATQAERSAHTKRRIIDAAKPLFEQHGFEDISVEQIAKLRHWDSFSAIGVRQANVRGLHHPAYQGADTL